MTLESVHAASGMTVRNCHTLARRGRRRVHPPGVDLHVYRLTDDLVPVVIISDGPLPPAPRSLSSLRVLIGVYEHIDDARAAALWTRERPSSPCRTTSTG